MGEWMHNCVFPLFLKQNNYSNARFRLLKEYWGKQLKVEWKNIHLDTICIRVMENTSRGKVS